MKTLLLPVMLSRRLSGPPPERQTAERRLDQPFGLGARHQHMPIDRKASAEKLAVAGQVGQRLTLATPGRQGIELLGNKRVGRLIAMGHQPLPGPPADMLEQRAGIEPRQPGGGLQRVPRSGRLAAHCGEVASSASAASFSA